MSENAPTAVEATLVSPVAHERQRVAVARDFAKKWEGRGYEKGDTHSFWLELLRDVMGMHDVTTNVRFEANTADRGYIDVVIPDAKTMIEQKSLGVDLDKPEMRQGTLVTPFEQAKRYADSLPNMQRPDFIIVSDFATFRIHNLNQVHPGANYVEFKLSELPEQLHLLDFLIDPQRARTKREEQVSLDAGMLIGKIYDLIRDQYVDPDSEESLHSLNVLCVRLVFCLFAEDAGLFPKDAFYNYLHGLPAQHVRAALRSLFDQLRTPPEDRDPYASDDLKAFPYVNGGLFEEVVEIPSFTEEIVEVLLTEVSHGTDWSKISPTIFGGVFESTLNPETRRSGGMHYTSPENIHRLIDPLFLDDLKAELDHIINEEGVGDRKRKNNLERFHDKLASLTFFDPACGSGNFLTETYIWLRRLENKVLSELNHHQTELILSEATSPLKVSLDQFYGIEINDFAVNVALTALWIADLQANAEAQTIVTQQIEDLPLKDKAHIVQGNALRMDWNEVLPAERADFIIGNPPFIGYSRLSAEQKEDRANIFGKSGGVLDYVACWHKKSADYMQGNRAIEAALVSTNSICQGQQVTPLWQPLFDDGIKINFAHRTFIWANEAADQAHVYCIIVGFSLTERKNKWAWDYRRPTPEEKDALSLPAGAQLGERQKVSHLNGYLADAPDVFLTKRSKPLSDIPGMAQGFKPADGGHLLLSPEDRDHLIATEPESEKWIRKFSMGAEFINGKDRYCLWLPEITPAEFNQLPHLRARVEACREWRLRQVETGDAYKLAVTPHLLRPNGKFVDSTYIGVPKVSSERRKYIPMGFVDDGMIPGDKLYFVPTDSRYVFGLLMSRVHNSWMRTVGGRLKSDYSYANTIIYNNFVWPDVSDAQHAEIESLAQTVLDARAEYSGATLADLYDPDNEWLYPALTKAHQNLDAAVERAYGLEPGCPEPEIVARLFRLYEQATQHKKQ